MNPDNWSEAAGLPQIPIPTAAKASGPQRTKMAKRATQFQLAIQGPEMGHNAKRNTVAVTNTQSARKRNFGTVSMFNTP